MSVANFIPTLWSARLLEHLDKDHVYVNLLNRDYEGEIKNYGDTVKVNQLGDVTIGDYEANGTISDPEQLTGEQQTLTIDQAKYFNFMIDDIDDAQTNPKLMDSAMERAAYGLADVSDQYAANLLAVNVSSDNVIGSDDAAETVTSANAYEYLVQLGVKLDTANVPRGNRWVVVPPWYHGMLLLDDRFVGYGTERNSDVLQNGAIGRAAGFTIYLSNNVPNTDGTLYKIIAGTNQVGSYAEQILENEAYRPESRFADAMKGLHVYGAQVFQNKCIAVLTANAE